MGKIVVLERMAPKSKRDMKRWKKQEKSKLDAIQHAFEVKNGR